MTLLEAENTVMPFGVHARKTLGAIAAADVTYLDYLLGAELGDTWLVEAVGVVGQKHGRTAKRGSRSTGGPQQMQFF